MAKGKKSGGFDMNKVKDFLVAKGERAGLAVCLLIGVGLLVMGIMSGMKNSTKDWSADYNQGAQRVKAAVDNAGEEPKAKDIGVIPVWRKDDQPVPILWASLIPIVETYKKNRRFPNVYPVISISDPDKATRFRFTHGLTVVSENKDAEIDYLLAGLRKSSINCDQ